MFPALYYFYGDLLWTDPRFIMGPADLLISWILPMCGVLILWDRQQATVGKMLMRLKILDAATLMPLSRKQELIRYFSYFLAILPLGLGFLWVALDSKKRGLHDYLAGSVVIRKARSDQ